MNISVKLAIALCSLLWFPKAAVADTLSTDRSDRPSYELAALGAELAASDNRQQALLLFARALELASSVDNQIERRTATIAIAAKMGTVGEKERALKVLEEAVKLSPNDDDYVYIADISLEMAKMGAIKRSRQLFARAVRLNRAQAKKADRTQDAYYRDADLVKIIDLMAKAGQLQEAAKLSSTLPSPLSRAGALNDVASSAIAKGKLDFARRTLDRVLETVSRIDNNTYAYMSNGDCGNDKFSLLAAVAKNLNLLGDLERALEIANDIYGCTSANQEYSQNYQISVYTGILNSFAKPKQIRQSWKSASKITDTIDKLDIWGAIALKLIEVGEIDLSFEVAGKVAAAENSTLVGYAPPYPSYKEQKLTDIAFKLAEVGATARARQVADLIGKPLSKEIEVFISIPAAKKLDRQGKSIEAKELLSRNLQLLDLNKLDSPNLPFNDVLKSIEVRKQIAVELAKIGQLEFGLQVVQGIPKDRRGGTLYQMAAALVDIGNLEATFQISEIIDDSIDLPYFLATIAPKLTTKEQLETALKIVERIQADAKIADYVKEEAIAKIALRLIATGQLDRGLELAKNLKTNRVRSSFALEIAKLGQHREAIAILESLPDDNSYKYEAIADLAVLLTK